MAAIEALLGSLYLAKRDILTSGESKDPYFVWMVSSEQHHKEIAETLFSYLAQKYGLSLKENPRRHYDLDCSKPNMSIFTFPALGIRIGIVTVTEWKEIARDWIE